MVKFIHFAVTIQYNKNLYSAAIQKCPGALTTREEIYVYIDIKNEIESICVKCTLEEKCLKLLLKRICVTAGLQVIG